MCAFFIGFCLWIATGFDAEAPSAGERGETALASTCDPILSTPCDIRFTRAMDVFRWETQGAIHDEDLAVLEGTPKGAEAARYGLQSGEAVAGEWPRKPP